MHSFTRPQASHLSVERRRVDGNCGECGQSQLAAYRVLGAAGWSDVVKCQSCLAVASREPAPRLGSLTPLGTTV